MKKILGSILLALLFPLTTWAISLSDLENNPDQYHKVGESNAQAVYVDKNSLQSIRYSPPYYTLSARSYFVNYTDCTIIELNSLVNYDYNRSLEGITNLIAARHARDNDPSKNNKETYKQEAIQEITSNNGLTSSDKILNVYTFDGDISMHGSDSFVTNGSPVKYGTGEYRVAEYMFFAYYNQHFLD